MPFPILKKNDKTNDPVLLFKTIFKHLNCLVSSVFTDGKDGHGLKLGKFGPTYSSFNAMPAEITKIIIMAVVVLPY